MGKEGRNQKENHLALRTPQLRGECPHQRSEHQNGIKPVGTHLGENDGKVSSRCGQSQAGRNQLAWRYKLCGSLSRFNQKAKSISPTRFIGFFLFAENHDEKQKEKWGVKIGNGDYDFGVRPTEHSARVMCSKSYLVLHITYLAESRRIQLLLRRLIKRAS